MLNICAPSPQSVRVALPVDAEVLAALCADHAAFERLTYSSEGHAERLHNALASGRVWAWLLEQHGRAVGYASVTLDFAT